jgi:hypothetical protein
MLMSLHHPSPDDLVAEAIRQMARELGEYDAERVARIDETLDRIIDGLAGQLGRCPTAYEVAAVAGVTMEEVVDARMSRRRRADRPAAAPELRFRCSRRAVLAPHHTAPFRA